MKKIIGYAVAAVVSLGGIAACSSDSKSTTTTKAATAGSTAATTAGGSNSATVDKFCTDVTDVVTKGPTASDYASKLTALTSQGASLAAAVAADPSLQTKLTDCLKKLVPGG